MCELHAGWAKQEIALPSRYPMAGYIAREGVSEGTHDSLFVRALVLDQGDFRTAIFVADLLLISPAWAHRLQRKIAKAIQAPVHNVIVAATHTHSGPLVDATPFRLSNQATSKRTRRFMLAVEDNFVQTAVLASRNLRPVKVSYTRCPIHNLATDRNNPKKNLAQPFLLVRLDAGNSRAVFGTLPCHPTVLGAENRYYSGDLHGEIARRYERQCDVAVIANGAAANISTRFTRQSQTRTQISRFASLVMNQMKSRRFQSCAACKVSIVSGVVHLPVRDFQQQSIKSAERTGRLADVANEGVQVAKQLSKAPEFHTKAVPLTVTLLQLGPISFAALPLELYAETGRLLWSRAKIAPLCYANGYWGYVYAQGAQEADYEVISSPFASCADTLLRKTILALGLK